ncbi:MAG: hypothetical protein J1E16_06390 [Muribaculaceae bacterium]|nr:hypothetical protein [Muribaculaceae bacterium]
MTIKTYAARGLLDFRMALKVGGAVIRIVFSGGTMGSNGVVSAKYTTESPAIQEMIEKSPQFESKRVYLFSEKEIKDENSNH